MKPIFYDNPAPLHPARHGGLRLRAPLDYRFAAKANAVPLNLAEIPLAGQWYPIAFTVGEAPRPMAILGLREGENLFVNRAGAWLEGAYVPTYVRRFPFILSRDGEAELLCIEERPEILSPTDGQPLFSADGQPAELLRAALRFCRSAQVADAATEPFGKALRDLDLLDTRTATAKLASGARLSLSGFLTVEETRFRALDDEAFLELRRKGWLSAIYAQIQSTLNWTRLADLAEAAGSAAAA
ncbi:SapC family protein [Phenylobacterium sp.]|uniref:SapC family protein n=1 Tax=Phenylobacterium sp. TaxID=1871053 RepID=UPI0019C93277|nr:SapC family protein [Phenylobacterium sp.]MBC7167631.1 SapC family protein [Phenylobacterium sp.]